MVDSLQAVGCRILFTSDTTQAPFVLTFETPSGERIGIVAYAFLATRTPTKNRPSDERSFQIKYGKKQSDNVHKLWIDPLGLYTTLLIGIDPQERFFVAADPAMHNPTKFFIRLEFKDEHADQIKGRRWYSWERERRSRAGLSEPIEVLVGGASESFLDLIRFERAAVGLSAGDRQLLAEKRTEWCAPVGTSTAMLPSGVVHPLATELGLGPDQILEVIAGARRLKMAVRGWVAEEHLRNALASTPGVTHCERLDVEGGPDLHVAYKGGAILAIECKNVLRKRNRAGQPRIDFQRTRASKSNPCSRFYAPSDFDIVAGCLHAVTEHWEFRYKLTDELAPHLRCAGKLSNNVAIDSTWHADPVQVFEAAYGESR